MRRSAIAPTCAIAIASVSQARPSGAPWKLPHDSTRPSGRTIGLSIAAASSAAGRRLGVGQSIASRAEDLWRAPQRIGVLHARIAVAVTCHDRRIREEATEIGRALRLPRLRAQSDEILGKGAVGSEERLDGHRGSDVGGAQEQAQVADCEHQHPEDPVGAVDQRQAFLLGENQRLDAGLASASAARSRPSGSSTSPSPISASAQWASGARSPLAPSDPCSGTTGVMPSVEQRADRVRDLGPSARAAHRERTRAQEHHRSHDLALHGRAHPGRVRDDQRPLQLEPALAGDRDRGERAEAGRHPVDRLVRRGVPPDDLGAQRPSPRARLRPIRPGRLAAPPPRPRPSRPPNPRGRRWRSARPPTAYITPNDLQSASVG